MYSDEFKRNALELLAEASEESEAQAEIRRLKRELEIARQERDILKHIIGSSGHATCIE